MNSFQTTLKEIFQKVWTLCVTLYSSARSHIKNHLAENKEKAETTEIAEDEETLYAKAFKNTLEDLANEVYGIHEPYDIAQRALRTACDFYDADWCGMFDVDMMLDLWMPFWWYNRLTGGMTQTQLKEGRVMGSFDMFRKMISDNAAYYQPDIENIRETKPEEYALFVSQDVKSFMSLPYSRREQGIIFLRNPKRFAGHQEMLRIVSNILIQEINEQKHLERMKINAASADIRKDADVIVNLFGEIEIITEQGRLLEAEMKSATCSKIFVLLMLNRNRGMSAKELSEKIWADKDYDNPTGNLRSALYRLRNMFELLSESELIVTTTNGYRINPELKIHTDYEQFEKLCSNSRAFMPMHDKIAMLKEAVAIYDGKLFPSGDGEIWHISLAMRYHMMYLNALEQLMKLLNDVGEYKMMHDIAMQSVKIAPDSTIVVFWLIIALRKSGAIEMAKHHFEAARARLLEEEFQELENRLKIAV